MLTLMLSALLTSAPGTVSVEAKSDTVNQYVIDGKPVSNFDGTQLAGKAIASYDITTTKEKGKVVQNHIITLAAPGSPKTENPVPVVQNHKITLAAPHSFRKRIKPLVVQGHKIPLVAPGRRGQSADSAVVQGYTITLAAPVEKQNDIFNQFFIHDDEDYSEMTKTTTVTDNGILRTTTEGTLKNGGKVTTTSVQIVRTFEPTDFSDKKLYIDGQEATMTDFQELKPSEIKSITVLEGKAAVKVWGDDAACGVIEVKTIKDNK